VLDTPIMVSNLTCRPIHCIDAIIAAGIPKGVVECYRLRFLIRYFHLPTDNIQW